jgi:hypothetical protein
VPHDVEDGLSHGSNQGHRRSERDSSVGPPEAGLPQNDGAKALIQ